MQKKETQDVDRKIQIWGPSDEYRANVPGLAQRSQCYILIFSVVIHMSVIEQNRLMKCGRSISRMRKDEMKNGNKFQIPLNRYTI